MNIPMVFKAGVQQNRSGPSMLPESVFPSEDKLSEAKLVPLLPLLVSVLQCTWFLYEVYCGHAFVENIVLQDPIIQPRLRLQQDSTSLDKPLGVFVLKVQHAHDALLSLCLLNTFFNHWPKYVIRIFAEEIPISNTTVQKLQGIYPLVVSTQIVVDAEAI